MKTPDINGKTPEEIKRNLRGCRDKELCQFCDDELHCKDKRNALAYIQQLESTYSQVSKALCGNENAPLIDLLQAVNQLRDRLAQAERERDAAVADLSNSCSTCKFIGLEFDDSPCDNCFQRVGRFPWSPMVRTKFEWRGVCAENTKEEIKCP